jgi:hypothetical protein
MLTNISTYPRATEDVLIGHGNNYVYRDVASKTSHYMFEDQVGTFTLGNLHNFKIDTLNELYLNEEIPNVVVRIVSQVKNIHLRDAHNITIMDASIQNIFADT